MKLRTGMKVIYNGSKRGYKGREATLMAYYRGSPHPWDILIDGMWIGAKREELLPLGPEPIEEWRL